MTGLVNGTPQTHNIYARLAAFTVERYVIHSPTTCIAPQRFPLFLARESTIPKPASKPCRGRSTAGLCPSYAQSSVDPSSTYQPPTPRSPLPPQTMRNAPHLLAILRRMIVEPNTHGRRFLLGEITLLSPVTKSEAGGRCQKIIPVDLPRMEGTNFCHGARARTATAFYEESGKRQSHWTTSPSQWRLLR